MARVSLDYFDGNNIYVCKFCDTHLTALNQLISKAFHGQTGKAYLFNNVKNVTCGKEQTKRLMTGFHVVCDIYCIQCHKLVGWKYIEARSKEQKYKQGKFILEKALIKKDSWID